VLRLRVAAILATGLIAVGCAVQQAGTMPSASVATATPVALPPPQTRGQVSLEETLAGRRSIRELSGDPLTPAEIGQLLWAAQGVTDAQGRRTAPSAGGLYPLELYAVTAEAVFHYLPADHAIRPVRDGDQRPRLRSAAFDQAPVGDAPLVVIVAAVPARTAVKYGLERARRYVDLEAGHAAQNLLLEAVALGLGGVPIGAFDDARVSGVLGLPAGEEPLYLLAIGHPR
jgi:SagB-type dehydrogenase family enzyme